MELILPHILRGKPESFRHDIRSFLTFTELKWRSHIKSEENIKEAINILKEKNLRLENEIELMKQNMVSKKEHLGIVESLKLEMDGFENDMDESTTILKETIALNDALSDSNNSLSKELERCKKDLQHAESVIKTNTSIHTVQLQSLKDKLNNETSKVVLLEKRIKEKDIKLDTSKQSSKKKNKPKKSDISNEDALVMAQHRIKTVEEDNVKLCMENARLRYDIEVMEFHQKHDLSKIKALDETILKLESIISQTSNTVSKLKVWLREQHESIAPSQLYVDLISDPELTRYLNHHLNC